MYCSEIFPERFFELVIVLRCPTETLYERLVQRQYNEKKISENMECEIMQVVLESAKESYDEHVIQELSSDTTDDMETNAARIAMWYHAWFENNS
jgi:adenylate kinase